MTDNMRLWTALGKTDPAHTKPFNRGGFRGTSIKPIYTIAKMTEFFGPCGKGWGIRKPEFQVVQTGAESLVVCTVCVWYMEDDATGQISEVYGVGGDTIEKPRKESPNVADDESFKKAYTDAVGNALKHIGVNSDVHMGLFDDTKYVNDLKAEFEEKARPNPQRIADDLKAQISGTASIAHLKEWRQQAGRTALGLPPVLRDQVTMAMIKRGIEIAATAQEYILWNDAVRQARERLNGSCNLDIDQFDVEFKEKWREAMAEAAA